jgi:hypothetical protein
MGSGGGGYLCRVEGWVYVRVHYTSRRKPTPGYGRPDLWCTGARATRHDTVTSRKPGNHTNKNQSQALFHVNKAEIFLLPLPLLLPLLLLSLASPFCHPLLLLPLPLLCLCLSLLCHPLLIYCLCLCLSSSPIITSSASSCLLLLVALPVVHPLLLLKLPLF